MKKSLIALAVLAASGAALAQSSVTIYGRVNLGVVKNANQSARLDAANGTSQLGFRGTEDLGGGLKANFDLRHRFSAESGDMDGTNNGRPFWQGVSTVGLSGGFGAVNIGRQLTALQLAVNASDPWGTETVGSLASLVANYATDARQPDGAGLGRTDSITYTTPNFGGFTGSLSYGFKNSDAVAGAAATTANEALVSTWLQYAAGPFMIGGGYEQNRTDDDVTAILGSWNFGFARLMAGYSQIDLAGAGVGTDIDSWNLGVAAPLGAAVIKAGFSESDVDNSPAQTRKFAIGAEYNLSKRTYLYTTVARNRATSALGVRTTGTDWDLGISHSF